MTKTVKEWESGNTFAIKI